MARTPLLRVQFSCEGYDKSPILLKWNGMMEWKIGLLSYPSRENSTRSSLIVINRVYNISLRI